MSDNANPPPAPVTDPDLRIKLAETEQLLNQARTALDDSARKHAIERELWAHGVIDPEAALLLTQAALAANPKRDPAAAVAELRRKRPFLFRPAPSSGAMAGHAAPADSGLDRAAADARQSGDRRSLLRYLRLKRSA